MTDDSPRAPRKRPPKQKNPSRNRGGGFIIIERAIIRELKVRFFWENALSPPPKKNTYLYTVIIS